MVDTVTLAAAYPSLIAAITVWREARGQPVDAQRGVAWAIRNRMEDTRRRWPRDPVGVCHQRKQFSCWNGLQPGDQPDPNLLKFPAPSDPSWLSCCRAWEEPGDDPTGGANHYHSIKDPALLPYWADPLKITAKIGAFTFYLL